MWKKPLAITIIFYLFALLQSSFLVHFSLFGSTLNLVFTLFFLLVFFENKENIYSVIFVSALAGFFLDIFSYANFGPSIVLMIIIGSLLKRTQIALKNTKNNYPYAYFLPLFIVSFLAYNFFINLYLNFLVSDRIVINLGIDSFILVLDDLLVASLFFYVYKKYFINKVDN